jgi:hypothetical protein
MLKPPLQPSSLAGMCLHRNFEYHPYDLFSALKQRLPADQRIVYSSHLTRTSDGFAHSFDIFPERQSHLLCNILADAGAYRAKLLYS